MIRIDPLRLHRLEQDYLVYVKEYLKNGVKEDKIQENINKSTGLLKLLFQYFKVNIDQIILMDFSKIPIKNKEFLMNVGYDESNKRHIEIYDGFTKSMILFYTNFVKTIAKIDGERISYGRWLTKEIGIIVCPYCNHNYIFTINDIGNNINTRPQFDHFFAKTAFPLFSLSLYNLIPCCAVCNKIKGKKEITFNPYGNHPEDVFFRLKNVAEGKPIHWITGEKPKIEVVHRIDGINESLATDQNTSVKKLGIDKVYGEHGRFAEELLDKIFAYHNDYYESLVKSFRGLGKTVEQIDAIIWGAYLNNESERPMSKLTHDILKQAGIKNY